MKKSKYENYTKLCEMLHALNVKGKLNIIGKDAHSHCFQLLQNNFHANE